MIHPRLAPDEDERAFFRALDDDAEARARLTPHERAALAASWAEAARDEHASIASFSRFALQLLAVGAPPDLIAGAHAAALDEVKHARLTFALASAYAGTPLGPGPLPMPAEALGSIDLPEIAAAAVREGCVGETLAALEAEAARDAATTPAPRAALDIIARDELGHAGLAWAFTRWAIGVGGGPVRAAVEAAFTAIFHQIETASAAAAAEGVADAATCTTHGRRPASERLALGRRALAGALRPAARALLA